MLHDIVNHSGTLPISAIEIGPRVRSFSQDAFETVKAGIVQNGGYLIQAVSIWKDGDAFKLCAGLHRLEACKALGWQDIPVRVFEADSEEEVRLVELDENLKRVELTPVEAAMMTCQREKVFLGRCPAEC